jgi:hypothetical protein
VVFLASLALSGCNFAHQLSSSLTKVTLSSSQNDLSDFSLTAFEASSSTGETISFATNGLRPLKNGWAELASHESFVGNDGALGSLSDLLIKTGASDKGLISYGWEKKDGSVVYSVKDSPFQGPSNFDFDGLKPNYFLIKPASGKLDIINLSVGYIGKESENPTGNFVYQNDGNGVDIIGYNGAENDVTIPGEFGGKNILKILNPIFYGNENIHSLKIPANHWYSLPNSLCEGAKNLLSVTIGSPVAADDKTPVYIPTLSFAGCVSLSFVSIAQGFNGIGSAAFAGDTSLTALPNVPGLETIGSSAFHGCSGLTNLVIPEGVLTIGDYAFEDCSNITSVTIPHSLSSNPIGMRAFKGLSSCVSFSVAGDADSAYWSAPDGVLMPKDGSVILCYPAANSRTTYKVPSSVAQIYSYAFIGSKNLLSVYIPLTVTTINEGAFANCTNLTIYCAVASEPTGWNSAWNPSKCRVLWGQTF